MSTIDLENGKKTHAARRLCELFRGRFSEDVAKKLVADLGGELEAADFLLNEDKEVVSKHLKESTSYLEELRRDSQKIATLLEKGIEFELRQFACGDCDRSWWKKVPIRKQVTKCQRCHVKYDPVPHDKEWGWAKFLCSCGNEFNAFGEMGITTSECYECRFMVPVDSVLPPRKRIGQRKSNNTHSCDAANCFNRHCGPLMPVIPEINMSSTNSTHASHHNKISYNFSVEAGDANAHNAGGQKKSAADIVAVNGATGGYPNTSGQSTPKECIHPQSSRRGRRVRTESKKHNSTGSTVATFMSQGSLDTRSIASMQSIPN